ncbi:MAG: (Fe-S)-binding protein [Candidatus Methanoperedens nitroreducens]|uniref:(Fe-S)-binding protein n=1 Tax=Candidatus Methanoperedens nitratireducens TaxID=1392998 RepID=A0A0P8CH36_9EURY|nr:MAG: 4Fe-4S binding protein [Candidatus Methanoperedens sp.]KPQ42012.1 MAG: (Fe-S)-binding protein [Candidatus Methanoperedens sp. BLZ1]MBZ0176367.1 FTR1 family protein [Candidatus Methanoperedens nitroreducens]MCX9078089.1 FTR1 family protein [Candidatus Methanoperedens sp.]
MIESFVITLREGIEAALIIGIMAAYLGKIGRKDLYRYLYIGTTTAVATSILVALIFGELYKVSGEAFEGFAALSAVAVLTYMIFWMSRHSREIKGELHEKVDSIISSRRVFGIAGLAFLSVLREGVETVLFLGGTLAASSLNSVITGTLLGIATTAFFAGLMFKGMYSLDIRKFFKYTGFILIVFAAGLTGQATRALQTAGLLPGTIAAWDTSLFLNESSVLGSLLSALFGYSSQPSVLQVIFYLTYLSLIGYLSIDFTRHTKEKDYADPFSPLKSQHWFYGFVRNRWVPNIMLIFMGIFFVFLLVVGYFGIGIGPFQEGYLKFGNFYLKGVDNNLWNFAIWVLWLPLVSVSAVFLGRFWCGNLCPLRGIADVARYISDKLLGKAPSAPYIRSGWVLPVSFVAITIIIKSNPFQSVARLGTTLFISIFLVALVVSFLFRKGTWCRYLCPIGGWLARIARLSILGIRPKRATCDNCSTKECHIGTGKAGTCPMFLNPNQLDSNRYCLECWNCVKNCPRDGMHIGLRMPGAEVLKPYFPEIWESIFIAGLIGMYMAFVRWEIVLPEMPFPFFALGAMILTVSLYLTVCAAASALSGIKYRETITSFGYIFLPLEVGTAIIAMGDDSLEFFNILVPVSIILLGTTFIWSMILGASITKNNAGKKAIFAFIPVAFALIGILLLWLSWFASGNVIDLT